MSEFGAKVRRAITVNGATGWVKCAAMLLVLFGVMHLLGWRDDVAILTGTESMGSSRAATVFRGAAYGMSYVGAVVASPILILGAGIRMGLERIWR